MKTQLETYNKIWKKVDVKLLNSRTVHDRWLNMKED